MAATPSGASISKRPLERCLSGRIIKRKQKHESWQRKKESGHKRPDSVGTKQRPVHTEILVRPIHRGVNDIGSWRSALRLADLGNRTKLYDLFTDLLIDGYLSDAIDKRIDAVTDADLAFTINGKQVDEIDALMDTPEFESLLREIMLSRFWGVSLVECLFLDGFGFKSIPRKHIRTKTKENRHPGGGRARDTLRGQRPDYPVRK